jgi:hypothetical protein
MDIADHRSARLIDRRAVDRNQRQRCLPVAVSREYNQVGQHVVWEYRCALNFYC